MKKRISVTVLLTLFFITLGLASYEPAPVIEPDGVAFEPNEAPSAVMAAYSVYAGQTISGEIDVADEDGDQVWVSAEKLIFRDGIQNTIDPNLWTFVWSWSPGQADEGINYIEIIATDAQGATDSRTIVIDVIVNHPPVIPGCRRN
jgi:hypothetical protein